MIRFYRVFARVLTIYALVHPFVYLGGEWYEARRMNEEANARLGAEPPLAAGWTVDPTDEVGDGSPLLVQNLILESVFSIPNILLALLMSLGIVGIGALCLIAASLMELAAAPAGRAAG